MSEFKVGDHVRFTADGPDGTVFEIYGWPTPTRAGIWTDYGYGGGRFEREADVGHLTKTDAPVGPSPKQVADAMTARQAAACGLRLNPKAPGYWSMTEFAPGDISGIQREMDVLTEKIQAAHAKMGGPSEDAKRDRILPALRKIVAEWSPAAVFDAITRAVNENEISQAEARELLVGNQPAPALDIDPRWEELITLKTAVAILRKDLAAERSRANLLADECGHLRSLADASEANVVAANAKVGDLESTLRSHERTIARLKSEISLLKRACR